jgi:CubicO group peptidase (beta-lactamase class C family)
VSTAEGLETVELASVALDIGGFCDPAFQRVRETFQENFETRGDVGAAVCVYHQGHKVVDLWAGWTDPERLRPWAEDTLVCMMSVGKGVASICLARLIEQGRLDLNAPVAHYWPAFAQGGKGDITVEQLISGQGGVLYADAAPDGSLLDWDVVIEALEKQAPSWPPGTKGGYHSMTAPFLFSELIHKVDGRPIEDYFREEFAEPLGLDYAFGLNDEQIARTATLIGLAENPTQRDMRDPTTKLGRAWRLRPRDPELQNTPFYLRNRARGYGAPRAIAKLYAALSMGGVIDGAPVLAPETIANIRQPRWEGPCGMTDRWYAYALGLFVNREMAYMGPNPRTFGHPGVGGALGFADPENALAFGYGGNALSPLPGVGDRCRALIDAAYASLDTVAA